MKKIIKGIFIPILVAILCGYVAGKYIFNTYRDSLYDRLSSTRLYLIQNGEYETMEVMREENNGNNYIYYLDDNKYKTVVGITRYYDNIEKIKSLYNDNLKVMEYYVENKYLDNKQEVYDKELNATDDLYQVKEIVDNILELYRSDDSIKLISLE